MAIFQKPGKRWQMRLAGRIFPSLAGCSIPRPGTWSGLRVGKPTMRALEFQDVRIIADKIMGAAISGTSNGKHRASRWVWGTPSSAIECLRRRNSGDREPQARVNGHHGIRARPVSGACTDWLTRSCACPAYAMRAQAGFQRGDSIGRAALLLLGVTR